MKLKHNITFLPSGLTAQVRSGESVLRAARGLGLHIDACCGGRGVCGKCVVDVVDVLDIEGSGGVDGSGEGGGGDGVGRVGGVKAGRHLLCKLTAWSDMTVALPELRDNVIVSSAENDEIAQGSYGGNGYGVAIDIGTTTIAAFLCDLESGETLQTACAINPQIPFGSDVVSRIAHCAQCETGFLEMRAALFNTLNSLIEEMAENAATPPREIKSAVIVGNTVMCHIAAGIDPTPIGQAPYDPVTSQALDMPAREIGLPINPTGNVHFLPCPAGFAGADIIAAIISTRPYEAQKTVLLIDVGTNSEICLCTPDGRIFITSCATGPALEGAQIKHGMRAAPGAIDKVRVSPVTCEPKINAIGDCRPTGICGSGIVDAVSQMAQAGVIEPGGKFSPHARAKYMSRDADGGPKYLLCRDGDGDIAVTQKDVRAVQLAKAALYAGAKMLTRQVGAEGIDEIILAGAFGSFLDKKNALELGMFPDCPLDNIKTVGNAAGLGARMALLSLDKRREAEEIAKKAVFVETAKLADYPQEFARAMAIPHQTDVFYRNMPYIWKCQAPDGRFAGDGRLAGERRFAGDELFAGDGRAWHNTVMLFDSSAGEYPFNNAREITPQVMRQIISNALDKHPTFSEGKPVEIPDPFSFVASLISPMLLYAERDARQLKETLRAAADALAEAVSELTQRGARLISLAGAEGVTELTGRRFFVDISGRAAFDLLQKIEPYMKNSATYICGKLSYSLHNAGMISAKPYRYDESLAYAAALLLYATRRDFKFIGHGCIHKTPPSPIIHKLELRR